MADNIARWIAGASAVGTALNMTVAYLTYRRVRPRVVVVLESAKRTLPGSQATGHSHQPLIVVKFRVVNRSATAVEVERLCFKKTDRTTLNVLWKLQTRTVGERSKAKTLEPFSGAQFEVEFPEQAVISNSNSFKHGYLTVTLANGQEVQGKKMTRRDFEALLPRPRRR